MEIIDRLLEPEGLKLLTTLVLLLVIMVVYKAIDKSLEFKEQLEGISAERKKIEATLDTLDKMLEKAGVTSV
jgi:hypothetical protein